MFSSLKLSNLRSRKQGNSVASASSVNNIASLNSRQLVACKPPRTPLSSSARRTSKCGSGRSHLCPSIGSLRSGSEPPRSRVNTVRINGAKQTREVADQKTALDTEYTLPTSQSQSCLSVSSRVTQVTLRREAGSLGFTLRGGSNPDPELSRPLTVTQVRPGGAADRDGTMRAGDRLVGINGSVLHSATLMDAQQLLQQLQHQSHCVLTLEYEVSILESIRHGTGPFLVEIELPGDHGLGVTLGDAEGKGSWISRGSQDGEMSSCVVVDSIAPGGTADRCGALRCGDQVLAVDCARVEGTTLNAQDVAQLIDAARDRVTLELLPAANRARGFLRKSSSASPTSMTSRQGSLRARAQTEPLDTGTLRHCETLCLTLTADHHGYGLTATDGAMGTVVIATIEPGSPADRCGCLQAGDRILLVHQSSGELTAAHVNALLRSLQGLRLETEFYVTDAVVPTSGVFSVRLAKQRGSSLGITVTAGGDGGAVICSVKRGSVAYRSGALAAGDRLLAVDSWPVAHASLRETRMVLQRCADVVALRVQKEEHAIDLPDAWGVVYTVELTRDGGSLGITLAGSEDCGEHIVISNLTPCGLAERTGALHEGDRLLAINGRSLRGHPLSYAVSLLQGSGNQITIKISRNRARMCLSEEVPFTPGLPSEDSAVESWDSQRPASSSEPLDLDFGKNICEVYATESSTVRRRLRTPDNGTRAWRSIDCIDESQRPSGPALRWENSVCSDCSLPEETRESYADRITPPLDYFDEAPSPLPLPPYLRDSQQTDYEDVYLNEVSTSASSQVELYQVTLFKDAVYEDFGFSVSDGLYERGVYVNRVRKGGPADMSVTPRPFDRILQVNETRTHDFDCCLTVPLIASAGEKLELTIARNSNAYPVFDEDKVGRHGFDEDKDFSSQNEPWILEENGNIMNRSITSSIPETL